MVISLNEDKHFTRKIESKVPGVLLLKQINVDILTLSCNNFHHELGTHFSMNI